MDTSANMPSTVPLGVIGALVEEIDDLKRDMQEVSTVELCGLAFHQGVLAGRPAVLVHAGMGKVNAAMATTLLIARFGVSAVVFTGVAGSLDARIGILDVVISESVVHADFDAVALGFEHGRIAELPERFIAANPALVARAKAACEKVLDSPDKGRIFSGVIATGDQFVRDEARKQEIAASTGALCYEMEGAAVGQVACRSGVPFVVIRTISDRAGEDSEMEFGSFLVAAAVNSARIVTEMARG